MYETEEQRNNLREAAASSKAFGEVNEDMKVAIETMERKRQKLIKVLVEKVKALPDNPRIERLGPSCFTVKSSDFATAPWCPFYHDFYAQYQKITEWIENDTLDELMVKIGMIIEKGFARDNTRSWWFHEDVRRFLKELE